MATYQDVVQTLATLNQEYPRPVISPLQLGERYDMHLDHALRKDIHYADADFQGVYFFFSAEHELLYVGKASYNSSIGKRVWSRFKYAEDASRWVLKPHMRNNVKSFLWEQVQYVAAIPIYNQVHAFEASAIEEYFITTLRPPLNG